VFNTALYYRRKEISSSSRATFLMADDREACLLISGDLLSSVAEYLAVAELGGSNHAVDRKDIIYLAAPLTNQVGAQTAGALCLSLPNMPFAWNCSQHPFDMTI
jgi:hypothetical protein